MPRDKPVLLSLGILLSACNQADPPDLVQISKDYCAIAQPCEPNTPWKDLEECEAYCADEYEKAQAEDKECYDTRIVMEMCIGSFESCEKYEMLFDSKDGDCQHEFMDFYVACMLP